MSNLGEEYSNYMEFIPDYYNGVIKGDIVNLANLGKIVDQNDDEVDFSIPNNTITLREEKPNTFKPT